MRPTAMFLRPVVAAALGCTLSGCCSDEVRTVVVEPLHGYTYPWVGDTVIVRGVALRNLSLFCDGGSLYTSELHPARFRYESSDTSVASLTFLGSPGWRPLLTAHAPGQTRIVAVTAGIRSAEWLVMVSPAIDSLRVTFTPATGRVGDTITVRLDAVDRQGVAITNALVWPLALIPPSDTLATWLTPHSPSGPPTYTPVVDRFVVRHAGVISILASAPHVGTPVQHEIADTIVMNVPSR